MLSLAFDQEGMWIYPVEDSTAPALSTSQGYFRDDQYASLDSLLSHQDRLPPMYRKIQEVLLAASLFRLSDSPWMDQQLASDKIFVPNPDKKRLHQWCPQIVCTLATRPSTKLQSENIAAFGVLILEIEANRKAEWIEADCDWISGERSNLACLARILKSWEDLVSDSYREVAKACLDFEILVETVNHQGIVPDKKGLAIILKYILEPLWREMARNFGILNSVFQGLFASERGPGRSSRISSTNTKRYILFDDDEAPASAEDK